MSADNHLDELPALWNTSPDNPAVRERQERAARETEFMIEHSPGYAAELAELKLWLTTYDVPAGGVR